MANWGQTIVVKKRLNLEKQLDYIDGNPFYQGRRLIERDSPIDKGVYLGKHQREAIVVDSEKYPELKRLYGIAEPRTRGVDSKGNKVFYRNKVLGAVYDTVMENMKYDNDGVEKIVDEFNVGNDGKIALDVFLQRKKGVCRHMGLTSAALLEMFKKNGYIRGKVSVDRNQEEDGGRHVWCRYTCNNGEVVILDVAQHFFGFLEKAEEKRKSENPIWSYARPEDNFGGQNK